MKMNIFQYKNTSWGQLFPDAFIAMGHKLKNGRKDSFYIILRSPFVSRNSYISCFDFNEKIGPCRNCYMFWYNKGEIILKKIVEPLSERS